MPYHPWRGRARTRVVGLDRARQRAEARAKNINSFSDKFGQMNRVILRESCKLADLHFLP